MRANIMPYNNNHGLFFMSLLLLVFSVSLCSAGDKTVFEVIGTSECADCKENNFKTSQAFSGLRVTIDCKLKNGDTKRFGSSELDKHGNFKVSLPKELVRNRPKIEHECYAQLHSASAIPCPVHNSLEASKITLKPLNGGPNYIFAPSEKIRFLAATCTSKSFWPYFKHPPLPPFGHPWLFPPLPPFYKPKPPSTPIYEPPPVVKPPVYKPPKKPCPPTKPKPPVYKPPVEKPPVYKPPVEKPPIYKPPVEKPPAYKPPVEKPPIYKPPVEKPPIYKPPVEKPPAYKPPIIVKPLPPPIHLYPIPPITKKPCPPLPKLPPFPKIPPKYFHHPKFGPFPPGPPLAPHP